jgi:NitT/TauT family transport system substrate-binding protein
MSHRDVLKHRMTLAKKVGTLLAIILLVAIVSACGGASVTSAPPTAAPAAQPTSAPQATSAPSGGQSSGQLTPVKFQLQWVVQSQFAGYYAAQELGYYKDEGLDVTILVGGPDIAPQTVLANGGADLAESWLPKALAESEQGVKLVNIAQVFQRSGTLEISWKDTNITQPSDWKGKKVASWLLGNEPEVFAAMRKAGIDPNNPNDVTIVKQPFDMSLLLNRQVDAAQAMIYNEYAQVLEAKNPKTGQLYQPSDLNVIDFNKVGTAMLQDGVFARADWISDPKNQDVATRFLRASFKGWAYCRDNFDACVNIVLKNGPTLGKGHMAWMLNEINALIWPSPLGIGIMDPNLYQQTVTIAKTYKIINNDPDKGAYRTDLAQKADDDLVKAGIDVKGANFQKQTIQVTPGGE